MVEIEKNKECVARAAFRALRPVQWVKNSLVAAPLFFAVADPEQGLRRKETLLPAVVTAICAAVIFCAISSGIYLLNDIHDRAEDALHPVKRYRPVASGALPVMIAAWMSAALLTIGLIASAAVSRAFFAIAFAYVVLQVFYSIGIKRILLLDVVAIACGFVMRAIAGAVAIKVDISPWLILCTFFISLFLALCKRRQEKVVRSIGEQRHSVKSYGLTLLNLLITIAATSTIISYSLYTVSAETVAKFGTMRLGYTIPFVVFGIFRYLHLVFVKDEGERPERALFSDVGILLAVALYLATFAAIIAL